jgi:gluconolactonase
MTKETQALAFGILMTALPCFAATAPQEAPEGNPEAVVDLTTAEGVRLLAGQWRYSDARIVETEFPAAGPDGQPTGAPGKTWDISPHAGAADFDDSRWEALAPEALAARRGGGRLSFNWYRISITVPATVGPYDTSGKTAVLETTIDDAAEVWVDGELARYPGQRGGSMLAGWNAANRLIVGRHVKPGQKIQLALFGVNGPLSNPPTNFIWVREAKLEFYPGKPGPVAITPAEVNVTVIRKDPALDAIVGPNPKIFKVAEGFAFTEGPIWIPDGKYLLFSDPNSNTIYKYVPDGDLSVFRSPSGYAGSDIAEYGQPGSNGLTLDRQGRLTVDQHGNRRVIRLEKDGRETVLVDRYQGKRLNSPNDLVYRSDGTLYITDPPFGLPKFFDDPRKELPFSGVFAVTPKGKVLLVTKELSGPNGIAFSPDEKFLYVGNWDDKKKIVVRYPLHADGSVGAGEVFYDMTSAPGEDAIDGMKVDQKGNLYVSGPGGLWILSPGGRHLGTIVGPKHPHNFNWGDEDGKTLYLCAREGLYRIRLNIAGIRP